MLHPFATDSSERRTIPFFIAVVAIVVAYQLDQWFAGRNIIPQWWYSPPVDTMALYGILYVLFDRVFWKLRVFRSLRIIHTPDLNGRWAGSVNPAPVPGVSDGLQESIPIEVTITQTWTSLRIKAATSQSQSHSVSGSIIVGGDPFVTYEYTNTPRASAPPTMHAHFGTTRLSITDDKLIGEYYSGRDRQNVGHITLERVVESSKGSQTSGQSK